MSVIFAAPRTRSTSSPLAGNKGPFPAMTSFAEQASAIGPADHGNHTGAAIYMATQDVRYNWSLVSAKGLS